LLFIVATRTPIAFYTEYSRPVSPLPKTFSHHPDTEGRSVDISLMSRQHAAKRRSIFYSFHDKKRTATTAFAPPWLPTCVSPYCISGLRNVITPRLESPRPLSRFPVCDLLLPPLNAWIMFLSFCICLSTPACYRESAFRSNNSRFLFSFLFHFRMNYHRGT